MILVEGLKMRAPQAEKLVRVSILGQRDLSDCTVGNEFPYGKRLYRSIMIYLGYFALNRAALLESMTCKRISEMNKVEARQGSLLQCQ